MMPRPAIAVLVLLAVLAAAAGAAAQPVYGPPVTPWPAAGVPGTTAAAADWLSTLDADPATLNPVSILAGAAQALPGTREGAGGAGGSSAGGMTTAVSIILLLTVLTLVPSIMLMTTCFVRIIVVLGLLKQALGTAQLPPPQVITGLAFFMTLLVMAPTLERIDREALAPYRAGQVHSYEDLWDRGKQPIRDFMFDQIEATGNWSSLYMVLHYRGVDTSEPERLTRGDVDMLSLIPAFMLSELKVAFLMGFRVYLPFLVIDMVIASLLISMGMMMLPPVLISLPFKLLLFVLVDGWQLIVGSLLTSFSTTRSPVASSDGGGSIIIAIQGTVAALGGSG